MFNKVMLTLVVLGWLLLGYDILTNPSSQSCTEQRLTILEKDLQIETLKRQLTVLKLEFKNTQAASNEISADLVKLKTFLTNVGGDATL